MALESEQHLGRFDLLSTLGTGGFATVYRADDTHLGRQVALKLLHPELAEDRTFVQRFHREARALARLSHPRIVSIYDVGETADGRPYLVMELLHGRPLSGLLAEHGALAPEQVARIVTQLGDVLDYLHAQNLVHRDLKPENVMVGTGDHITLLDFGIARSQDDQVRLTKLGRAMGTAAYMAPEVAAGRDAGREADYYGLGVLVYELLTGEPRFARGLSIPYIIHDLLHAEPPAPRDLRPDLPEAMNQVVVQQLAREPDARYPSATTFADALRQALGLPNALAPFLIGTPRDIPTERDIPVGHEAPLDLLMGPVPDPSLALPAGGADGRCGACGSENRPDARFCKGCGIALNMGCSVCGAERQPDAVFCDRCGARLPPATKPASGAKPAARQPDTVPLARNRTPAGKRRTGAVSTAAPAGPEEKPAIRPEGGT